MSENIQKHYPLVLCPKCCGERVLSVPGERYKTICTLCHADGRVRRAVAEEYEATQQEAI
jgi:hypothetical protein